jgi:hypothetical protein
VPAQWTAAQVMQGKDSKKVPVQKEAGGSYVLYRVTPNAGVVRVTKAQ